MGSHEVNYIAAIMGTVVEVQFSYLADNNRS